MIVGNRNENLSTENMDTGVNLNVRDPYMSNLSNKDIDDLIGALCETRSENPDVVIMDRVLEGQHNPPMDPLLAEKLEIENSEADIERELLKGLIENTTSIEEMNMYKTNGLYNRYEKHIINEGDNTDMSKSIEDEIALELEREMKEEEVQTMNNTDVEIVEENSFQSNNEEFIDITDEVVEEVSEELPVKLDDDIPASELHPEDEDIKSNITQTYGDVTDSDVEVIMSVMKRYQAGEKFNVYNALPQILRDTIKSTAMEVGVTDNTTLNYFAKNLINDIISDTFISKEFNDFEKELEEVTAPMNNIQGLVFDTYTDDLKTKFEDNMRELSEKVKEEDPDKSVQLAKIADNFNASYTLNRIIKAIEERPSLINKAYKTGRDSYNKVRDSFNAHFENSTPKVKTLDTVLFPITNKLGYSDEYAKTLAVLINNSIMEEVEKGGVENHIYAYFTIYGFLNINLTANSSELTKILCEAVFDIMSSVESYMTAIQSSKKKSKKRR